MVAVPHKLGLGQETKFSISNTTNRFTNFLIGRMEGVGVFTETLLVGVPERIRESTIRRPRHSRREIGT